MYATHATRMSHDDADDHPPARAFGRSLHNDAGEYQPLLARRVNVVLNWFEELKERVPTGR